MEIFSKIISWMFIPLLLPIYALAIAMYFPSLEQNFFQENTLYFMDEKNKIAILLIYTIFTFIAPAISILILLKFNNIQTIEMDDKTEREIPILLTAIYVLVLALFIKFKAPNNMLPKVIYILPWGGFFASVISIFISRKDKISIHALGAGMFLAFQFYYYNYQIEYYFEILLLSALICGLIMTARLYLMKHNLKQIAKGFVLGFCIMFITLIFYPR